MPMVAVPISVATPAAYLPYLYQYMKATAVAGTSHAAVIAVMAAASSQPGGGGGLLPPRIDLGGSNHHMS